MQGLVLLFKFLMLLKFASSFGTRSASLLSTRGGSKAFSSTTQMAATSKPFAVVVQAEIKPDRMDEFLEMIKNNAENSRKEPGCIRFDVLRSQDDPNKFTFVEIYTGMDAVDYHKKQPHYAAWNDFKESGGTVSSVSLKNDGEFVEV